METYNNTVLEGLPQHLKQYVVPQHYARYTPIDQAIWRYVMRQNYAYLKDVAYYPYIPGLKKAGLTIENIPNLQEMNDALKQIGWGAVTVDGFIPPSAFMEFQAHRVLVIAADIRQIEHIEYTPAPDIIHESSGHAPIIGEPEYAAYLQYFGEIGAKAMFSAADFALYESIRRLSIIKEKKDATAAEIAHAEAELTHIQENMGEPSEMALLSRLHWWTVEYGLIGTPEDPKIYGAGLLSSIGESASCMRPDVPKLNYDLDTLNYPYDITQPQPQLFVTPDFKHVHNVLDAFADGMSFRRGGKESVDKAIACKNVCTAVYSSGLQVSGIFKQIGDKEELTYLKTEGPTALAFADKQLYGHGKSYHRDGFSSPVGRLKGINKPLEDCSDEDLQQISIGPDKECRLTFTSGIEVAGNLHNMLRRDGKIILLTFADCHVYHIPTGEEYFKPEWGMYDMAVGEKIVSVFAGAADKDAYEQLAEVSSTPTSTQPADEATADMYAAFAEIRKIRATGAGDINPWLAFLKDRGKERWLAYIELLEIAVNRSQEQEALEIEQQLEALLASYPDLDKLIRDGIRLAKDPDIALLLSKQ